MLVKEITPKEWEMTVIFLFATFLSVGSELLFAISWFWTELRDISEYQISMLLTSPPATLSTLQLLLSLFVFKRDTPIQLSIDSLYEEIALELKNFFPQKKEEKVELIYSKILTLKCN